MNRDLTSIKKRIIRATPHQLSPETINQLLANQEKELELRAKELSLQTQQDKNSFEFSKSALAAQVNDRSEQREFIKNSQKNMYIFIGVIVLAIIVMLVIALFLNKDTIVVETLKILLSLVAGGIGGYGLKANQVQSEKPVTKP